MSKQETDPVKVYLDAVTSRLAAYDDNGYNATFLNNELAAWERREAQLAQWCEANGDGPCPFPMNAIQIATIRLSLNGSLEALREKSRSMIESANV